jgi:hypothetical protein
MKLTLSHTVGTTHHSGKPATARLFDEEFFGGPGTLISSSESVAPRKGTAPDQSSVRPHRDPERQLACSCYAANKVGAE